MTSLKEEKNHQSMKDEDNSQQAPSNVPKEKVKDSNNQSEQQANKSVPIPLADGSPNKPQKRRQSNMPDLSNLQNTESQSNWKRDMAIFLQSRFFDYIIIFLVLIYTLLVFIYFALDTTDNSDNNDIQFVLKVVYFVELAILIIFIIEIILKIVAFTVKEYFKDKWLVFDAIVIVISIVLVCTDMAVDNESFSSISKVIRGIFRFLRLFLVFRKLNQFKKIQSSISRYNVKTPVEKILEIINNLKENLDEQNQITLLDWCIQMISSNKLYEPIFEGTGDKDAQNWINNYSQKQDKDMKQKKMSVKPGQVNTNSQAVIQKQNVAVKDQQKEEETDKEQIHQNIIAKFKTVVLPDKVQTSFEQIDQIGFDLFTFHEQNIGNELGYLMSYLFQKHDIFNTIEIDPQVLFKFSNTVQAGYHPNPYHNKIHAFDVTQTVYFFLNSCKFIEIGQLSQLEICIMLVGAACHDYDHPGLNNPYLINTRHELAIRYNDKSPLENHHVSSIFFLMKDDSLNILSNLAKEDFKKTRERLISMILSTDMSVHFSDLAKLKGRLVSNEFNPKDKDKPMCMDILLHAADVSNPFKPFEIYQLWAKRVLDEFWAQGDKEREQGLTITYLCDRYTTNTSKSQIGFIDFIVKPFYETVKQFLPLVDISVFESNKEKWKEQIEFYDKDLERLKQEKQNADQALANGDPKSIQTK